MIACFHEWNKNDIITVQAAKEANQTKPRKLMKFIEINLIGWLICELVAAAAQSIKRNSFTINSLE